MELTTAALSSAGGFLIEISPDVKKMYYLISILTINFKTFTKMFIPAKELLCAPPLKKFLLKF